MVLPCTFTRMGHVVTDDGVRLHSRSEAPAHPCSSSTSSPATTGASCPRSSTSGRYRCIVYAARGYPPSDVPAEDRVLAGAGGGRCAGDSRRADSPARTSSASRWAGSAPCTWGCATRTASTHRDRRRRLRRATGGPAGFRVECEAIAAAFRRRAPPRWRSATRSGPRACSSRTRTGRAGSFRAPLAEHDALGSALTMLGVQRQRPRSTTCARSSPR